MANAMYAQRTEKQVVRSDSSGAVWLLQAITGLLLIFLLGLHMVAHHYVAEGGLRTFDDVIAYISNPIIFVLEVAFLIVVTPHAMLGLRAVLLDLGLSKEAARTVNWLLAIVGVVIIVYGVWLALALQRL